MSEKDKTSDNYICPNDLMNLKPVEQSPVAPRVGDIQLVSGATLNTCPNCGNLAVMGSGHICTNEVLVRNLRAELEAVTKERDRLKETLSWISEEGCLYDSNIAKQALSEIEG